MELKDTVDLMNSSDYKDRFRAEYYQTKIRCDKLNLMIEKYASGNLNFTPKCSIELLKNQSYCMDGYLNWLKIRAEIESIEL